jgi:hypothetical protein
VEVDASDFRSPHRNLGVVLGGSAGKIGPCWTLALQPAEVDSRAAEPRMGPRCKGQRPTNTTPFCALNLPMHLLQLPQRDRSGFRIRQHLRSVPPSTCRNNGTSGRAGCAMQNR